MNINTNILWHQAIKPVDLWHTISGMDIKSFKAGTKWTS